MSETTESILAKLNTGISQMCTSEKWMDWLRTQAKFHSYSWRNTLLIWIQKPEATQCAGYGKWREMNRYVKKGEKGIAILAPCFPSKAQLADGMEHKPVFFRTVYVFDISQTDGDELPEIAHSISGEEMGEKFDMLAAGLNQEGYNVSIADGEGGSNGYLSGKNIVINKNGRPINDQFRTLCHEGAHALLGHQDSEKDAGQREIEAESTAFVVCGALGIDSGDYTFGYVSTWARGDPKEAVKTIGSAMKTIGTAAGRMLTFCGV